MQNHAAVYRTSELLKEGVPKLQEIVKEAYEVHIQDKTLIWNTDLIETLELQNMVYQGLATVKYVVAVCAGGDSFVLFAPLLLLLVDLVAAISYFLQICFCCCLACGDVMLDSIQLDSICSSYRRL